ncbi:MAG: TonB-dependent siderophore receptor [Gammaproteobacteria bacterium]|uniref:TonB-dependent siderophore receptor n=1 Tax=Rhodoferax sp. TaxID=50421 RepID=UPI0017E91F7A|nr:TonB-dependent siderophore receptor [Rhodoferax sp.]MBU3898232.1 TonB-dependent siderophore receptor [Gammaproteobacteria bacterium]MBA3059069.1 TonB-dependent siderophore receptor [Rhodoferax sp.]MBU3996982.1 TonB-dependent siderophore receptor [Gammaproteobacteria bacterium]MBU4081417.1 TonB-dependent siderophore receptor [Gammaproteobacteria bacterium]MBU4114196.1 TonB-dependent siderophore receptor [Gammaproteobacteria bacterium]
MAFRQNFKLSPTAAALALFCALPASGQNAAQLAPVTVRAKSAPVLDVDTADVGAFSAPLAKTPQSITVLSADLLDATASTSLSQAIKLDASLADSYNTTGYIESLSVRGFLLEQGNNFSRNGLAVSNFTPLALENKERIEVLKGVAGLQSGVAAPGGRVNLVTKVPLKDAFTSLTLSANEYGGSKLHLDANTSLSGVGIRVNLASEGLRNQFDRAQGSREFASVALAAALSPNTALTADLEYQHKQQPSVPGLGLLDRNGDGTGETLPAPIFSKLNLNNQSWSQPFEASTSTAQLALNHRINTDWQARLALSTQRSTINDRLAFPDGCSSTTPAVYPGLCANGDVDMYDYRSEGEKHSASAWEARLTGRISALGRQHRVVAGLGGRRLTTDLAPTQAYNWVGITNIYNPVALPASPTPNDLNTNSRERALDAFVSVSSELTASLQSFVGLRVSSLQRSSERSDGSRALALSQPVTTPWAGLAWSPTANTMAYVSWGQGVELETVPNRPSKFVNAGDTLPAFKSEQTELGLKWQADERLLLTAAAFSIDKPYADSLPNVAPKLLVAGSKTARHRGLEFTATGRLGSQWSLQASAMLLDAKFTQALDPELVNQQVTNVPRLKASVFADYKVALLPGLSLNALLSGESGKKVTSDGSVELPSAWQLDAGLRYQTRLAGRSAQWKLNVENLSNRSYWREAPTTYWGGVYLFPSTPRTVRASVTVDF